MDVFLRSAALGLRAEQQGRAAAKFREIFRAEEGKEKKCVLCCTQGVPVYSHWDQGKSYYCVRAENGCPYCLRGGKDDKPRLRVYFGAIEPEKYHQVLAEVTDLAYRENTFLSCAEADLKGVTLFLKRKGPRMDGRVVARCDRAFLTSAIKGALRPFDVPAALDKFFVFPTLVRVDNISADPLAPVWAQRLDDEAEPGEVS
jgi:hypothetical protein